MCVLPAQLDGLKAAVSSVRALAGRPAALLAATTDATLRIIDARTPHTSQELKVCASIEVDILVILTASYITTCHEKMTVALMAL